MSEGVGCVLMNVQSSDSTEYGVREIARRCNSDPCAEGDDDNAGADEVGNDCGVMTGDGRY